MGIIGALSLTHIAKPLHKLFCKDAEFEWKNKEEEAFNTLKEKITKELVLRVPNFSKDWYILVDASKDGVLTQVTEVNGKGSYMPVC